MADYTNGKYDNSGGVELNAYGSNEGGQEFNDIAKKSKKKAKAISYTVSVLAVLAIFLPIFMDAFVQNADINFSNLFSAEFINIECTETELFYEIEFFKLDSDGNIMHDELIDANSVYFQDIVLNVIQSSNEGQSHPIEIPLTDDLAEGNWCVGRVQNLTPQTKYTLVIKIGSQVINQTTFTTK